jgi:5-methylthioadenosine/S-adenosylhomocysteine deaminase
VTKPDAKADLIVTNGNLLTMDPNVPWIEDGALSVSGGRIVEIGPAAAFEARPAVRRLDAGGGIVMPGLVNCHTHAAMTCFRGLADDLPLETWLNEHIFPAEARLDEEMVHWGTLLACAEMIRSGTTCFCDMYLFEEAVARAAKQAGMRAVVGEVLYDFPSPNYGPIEKGFAYTRRLAARWRDDPLISVAVEPHSPYLCNAALLEEAAGLAEEAGLLLVLHLSETRGEVENSIAQRGVSPVGHLARLGVLSSRLLACHCVWVSEGDIETLAGFGVKVAHNPESNMKLASGIAPVPQMIEAGICVGLGTDGCASNNDLDLFAEMDTAAKLHKVNTLDPTVLDAARVLKMATVDGAAALGLGTITGSLTPGKRADLVVVETRRPHLTPLYHPVSHLVYAVRGGDVASTVIDGRVVMEDRKLLTLDMSQIGAAVSEIAGRIRSR